MAELILSTPTVLVNAVDLSSYVREVRLRFTADEKEITASGDTFKDRLAGLKDVSCTLLFNQDFAAAKVDATLFPLLGAAPFAVSVKPTNAAVSATNPNYNGNAILTDYPPIDGAVGDALVASVSLLGAGTWTRAVA